MKRSPKNAGLALSEMQEFAGFSARSHRYIRRSLDVALKRGDADPVKLWSRTSEERYHIKAQQVLYQRIPEIKAAIPKGFSYGAIESLMAPLLRISAFDLADEGLDSFSSYRFLYERIFGADIRPWLPASFCGASALPNIKPSRRKELLQSLSENAATAPGWSARPPTFFPEWMDKELT